ncbi:hypothetical protein NL676_005257 [Syzygium grande]|nr:hypothetical protein NL676_005257 [Syzygium grande]
MITRLHYCTTRVHKNSQREDLESHWAPFFARNTREGRESISQEVTVTIMLGFQSRPRRFLPGESSHPIDPGDLPARGVASIPPHLLVLQRRFNESQPHPRPSTAHRNSGTVTARLTPPANTSRPDLRLAWQSRYQLLLAVQLLPPLLHNTGNISIALPVVRTKK